jgi:hypothetical protein
MIKKLPILLVVSFLCLQSFGQINNTKTYTDKLFSITYPNNWESSNENGILNFYPIDQSGAITISTYANFDLPLNDLKQSLLELTSSKVNLDSVKVINANNPIELYFECISNDIKWIAKAFKKGKNLIFITINSSPVIWEQKSNLFLDVLKTFTLK